MSMKVPLDMSIQPATLRRGLLVMRGLYFLYFAGVGAFWTFINVYYRSELGLSGLQIGLANTIPPLVAIFAATLWGMLNDRLGRPRVVLAIVVPGLILAVLGLSTARAFGWIVLFSGLIGLFNSATIPLLDNTTLRLLGERRGQYGRYRVFGSVGFILTTLSVGVLYEATGLHAIFYTYSVLMGLLVLVGLGLPNARVHITGSLWSGVGQMVRQRAWVIFAVSAVLLWISNNGTMAFIAITVKAMGGSERLIGLVWMTSAIAEIPIMLTSDRLLRRAGPTPLLIIAFVTFIFRAVLLALMPSPNWAPWITVLGGVAFSLFWMSAVSYANESAPAHLKSTAQGVLFSVVNLAGMSGSLLSGWLFDQAGPRGLFWVMGGFALAGLVIFSLGRLIDNRRGPEDRI